MCKEVPLPFSRDNNRIVSFKKRHSPNTQMGEEEWVSILGRQSCSSPTSALSSTIYSLHITCLQGINQSHHFLALHTLSWLHLLCISVGFALRLPRGLHKTTCNSPFYIDSHLDHIQTLYSFTLPLFYVFGVTI